MKTNSVLTILYSGTLLLLSACVTPVEPLPSLAIKTPAEVENGNFVPFLITAGRPLVSGEELVLLANNEVVYKVRTSGKVTVYAFSGRVRMLRSGTLSAVVTTRGGAKVTASEKISIARGAVIPANGVTGNSNKLRVQGDEILALFINDMPRKGFIESATITLSDGDIQISGSPLLSEKPQLGFRTPSSLKKVEVTAVATPAQRVQ